MTRTSCAMRSAGCSRARPTSRSRRSSTRSAPPSRSSSPPSSPAARRIASVYPGDPGVIVALLMNHVVLHSGEAIFLRAGLLHAYLAGLGVEVMAASDNVLRGGLTPKHVDVDELLAVLDAAPGRRAGRASQIGGRCVTRRRGLRDRCPGLRAARAPASARGDGDRHPARCGYRAGHRRQDHGDRRERRRARCGRARPCFITQDESPVRFAGDGEVFVAQPGAVKPRRRPSPIRYLARHAVGAS